MSRSNPHENASPNPATRWFEWNGETGAVRYYDKDAEKTVEIGLPFQFVLLDQLGSVGGWHKHSDCKIYSNEVKDTRQDVLVVRTKRDGTIAQGLYRNIKEQLAAVDGQFVANLYIAYKTKAGLAIGSLRIKGVALKAWSDFVSSSRDAIWSQAVEITSFTEGKKGRIVYRAPVFELRELSDASDVAAKELDKRLQEWLKGYFSRTRRDQVEHHASQHVPEHDGGAQPPAGDDWTQDAPPPADNTPITDDDIPF